MNRKDLMTVMTVAAGTAVLTLAALWPDSLGAGDEPQRLLPKIAQPTLLATGVELTLSPPENRVFEAGDEPVLELTALNTQEKHADITVHLSMSRTSPADPLSRVVRVPTAIWHCDQSLALAPKETKTIVLNTQTKLPPNSLISVSLEAMPGVAGLNSADKDHSESGTAMTSPPQKIVALSFSTLLPRGGTTAEAPTLIVNAR